MSSKLPVFYWCETYKMNFYFHIGWSPKDFCDYGKENYGYERNYKEMGNGSCLEVERENGDLGYVIWIRKKSMHAELAHECLHAALFLFDHHRINYDGFNSEPLCYLVESLVRNARG